MSADMICCCYTSVIRLLSAAHHVDVIFRSVKILKINKILYVLFIDSL
jgi:hypothetical protein